MMPSEWCHSRADLSLGLQFVVMQFVHNFCAAGCICSHEHHGSDITLFEALCPIMHKIIASVNALGTPFPQPDSPLLVLWFCCLHNFWTCPKEGTKTDRRAFCTDLKSVTRANNMAGPTKFTPIVGLVVHSFSVVVLHAQPLDHSQRRLSPLRVGVAVCASKSRRGN